MGKVAAKEGLVWCEGERGEGGERTGNLVAVEDAEAGAEHGEQEELDDAAGDSVDGVDGANLIGADSEAAREAEGEVCVSAVRDLTGVVEKDGQNLIVRDRVQGEEGVRHEVDDGLVGKDLGVAGGLGLGDGVLGSVGVGGGEEGSGCLVVDKGLSAVAVFLGRGADKGPLELLAQSEAPVGAVTLAFEGFLVVLAVCFLSTGVGCLPPRTTGQS